MVDGTMCDSETTYRDPAKFKIVYKLLTTDMPEFKDGGEITCSIRMRPVTFSGCPFMQSISDNVVCKMGCPMKEMPVKASQKTFFEWRTKCTKPIPMEQIEMIRSLKVTMLSDMMKDMSGEKAMMDMRRSTMDMDLYVAKKLGDVEMPKMPAGSK